MTVNGMPLNQSLCGICNQSTALVSWQTKSSDYAHKMCYKKIQNAKSYTDRTIERLFPYVELPKGPISAKELIAVCNKYNENLIIEFLSLENPSNEKILVKKIVAIWRKHNKKMAKFRKEAHLRVNTAVLGALGCMSMLEFCQSNVNDELKGIFDTVGRNAIKKYLVDIKLERDLKLFQKESCNELLQQAEASLREKILLKDDDSSIISQ